MGSILEFLNLNGISIFTLLIANIWIVRYILAFQKETRDEYRSRLTEAILELEQQKTINIKLELKIQRLELMAKKAN